MKKHSVYVKLTWKNIIKFTGIDTLPLSTFLSDVDCGVTVWAILTIFDVFHKAACYVYVKHFFFEIYISLKIINLYTLFPHVGLGST